MLELQNLYNHLEYEYNEDLDYIDEIYFIYILKDNIRRLFRRNYNEN